MKFTSKQIEALELLAQHAGKRVLVLTSQYKVAEEAERMSVGKFNASTLRGLAEKEVIKLEPMWRGAWVTVPPHLADVQQFIKDMGRYGK